LAALVDGKACLGVPGGAYGPKSLERKLRGVRGEEPGGRLLAFLFAALLMSDNSSDWRSYYLNRAKVAICAGNWRAHVLTSLVIYIFF
jgi:hypothetical protein